MKFFLILCLSLVIDVYPFYSSGVGSHLYYQSQTAASTKIRRLLVFSSFLIIYKLFKANGVKLLQLGFLFIYINHRPAEDSGPYRLRFYLIKLQKQQYLQKQDWVFARKNRARDHWLLPPIWTRTQGGCRQYSFQPQPAQADRFQKADR